MSYKIAIYFISLLVTVAYLVAQTDNSEGEKEWYELCGKTIKTVEGLKIHNSKLPLPRTQVKEIGLKLRVLTYNIHNFRGYPEDLGTEKWNAMLPGKRDSREKLDLQLGALGMLDAHIASLQECFHDKQLQLQLIDQLGYKASFFPASYHRHCAGATLSRYPLIDSVNLTFMELYGVKASLNKSEFLAPMKRFLGRSLVRLPGGQEILVYGGHYEPASENELALVKQIYQIDRALQRPMIWMGDLNIERSHPLYSWFKKIGLVDGFMYLNLPHTTTSLKGDRSRGGIDYIFCTPDIANRLESIEVVSRGPVTLDPNDQDSVASSDHFPVLAVFRF